MRWWNALLIAAAVCIIAFMMVLIADELVPYPTNSTSPATTPVVIN